MLKDIHLRFSGFHGSAGRCQIRLARLNKDKPLVVVCSQYRNYFGTSITNGLEVIVATLFRLIANNQIDGISFEAPIPTYDEWNSDASFFDKILAKTFPAKYGERFTSNQLDIETIFKQVVWIEHYPVDTRALSFETHFSLIQLEKNGGAVWRGRPTNTWLIEHTGFGVAELLPNEDSLDLEAYEKNIETFPRTEEELQSIPGYNHVRWTKDLLESLPGMLSSARTYQGRHQKADLEESSIQDEIETFFAVRLPAVELFDREYPFSKALGIHTGGKEKALDFAIFTPERESLDSILEIKRTSSKSTNLLLETKKDFARLLLMSKKFQCSCYLLVCGDGEIILSELSTIDKYLSLIDEDESRDRNFSALLDHFDLEYRNLLKNFDITTGSSRLQGVSGVGANQAFLWQIASGSLQVETHRPYKFRLLGISRA